MFDKLLVKMLKIKINRLDYCRGQLKYLVEGSQDSIRWEYLTDQIQQLNKAIRIIRGY